MNDARDLVPVQRRAVAYHEAGHAAVASRNGYRVCGIGTDGWGSGAVEFRPDPADEHTVDGRCRLLSVDIAGRIAASIALDDKCDIVESFLDAIRDIRTNYPPNMDRDHAIALSIEGDNIDVEIHLRGAFGQADARRANGCARPSAIDPRSPVG
jgi:hypothetical protein